MKHTNAIVEYLQKSGESWDAYAERTGVSRATLYRIIGGSNDPRLSSVEKLLASAGYKLCVVPASSTPEATT